MLVGEEFAYGALHASVRLELDVDETLGADLRTLHEVGQRVGLLAGVGGATGSADAHGKLGVGHHLEAAVLNEVGDFHERHAEADVRLVAAVEAHGVVPCHARERLGEVYSLHIFKNMLDEALEHLDDVFLLHEAHFAVYLRELRLAVGTQVFVAEALGYLEVTVKTADHQQLFEELRALRQGVELARIHARGHHEVAGALRRGFHQDRGFYLEEPFGVEVTAYLEGHLVAQLQVLAHAGTAQVQVAVFHTEVVAAVGIVFDGEGRDFAAVEHTQRAGYDFNFAGGEVRVLVAALGHFADHFHHKLAAQGVGSGAQFGVGIVVEHYLRDAVAVTQIYESHTSHFAQTLHPSCQFYFFSGIF